MEITDDYKKTKKTDAQIKVEDDTNVTNSKPTPDYIEEILRTNPIADSIEVEMGMNEHFSIPKYVLGLNPMPNYMEIIMGLNNHTSIPKDVWGLNPLSDSVKIAMEMNKTIAIPKHVLGFNPMPDYMKTIIGTNKPIAIPKDVWRLNQLSDSVKTAMDRYKSLSSVLGLDISKLLVLPKISEMFPGILEDIRLTRKNDKKIQLYKENENLWNNIKSISSELIVLPSYRSQELMDYLCEDTFSIEGVNELIGEFNVRDLYDELEYDDHQEYMFKEYLIEIIESYLSSPKYYKTLIPSLFLIVEGTMSKMFKIRSKGTASEIKRVMNIFWDLFNSAYLSKDYNLTISFENQLTLTNMKRIFEVLTESSTGSGIKLNRNLVLHGRSNPSEWKQTDFLLLMNLIKITLEMKRALEVLLEEFTDLIDGENADIEKVEFSEYKLVLKKIVESKKIGVRKNRRQVYELINKEIKTDLNNIFTDIQLVEVIISKSNLNTVADDLTQIA